MSLVSAILVNLVYGFYCQNEVAYEGETGKLFRAGFHDRHGRTVLILRPGLQVVYLGNFCGLHFLASIICKICVATINDAEHDVVRKPDEASSVSPRECYPKPSRWSGTNGMVNRLHWMVSKHQCPHQDSSGYYLYITKPLP